MIALDKTYLHNLKSLSLAVLIAMSFLVSSCSNKQVSSRSSNPKVTIYYTKASDDLGVILIPVVREVQEDRTPYETAIKELFLGPNLNEREKLKLKSEIPEGSRLIKITENPKSIRIDISGQFMSGGGSESMQVRFRQLRETALNLAKGRPVYLYMDGQKVTTIGGEGLEIPQPFNRDELEEPVNP